MTIANIALVAFTAMAIVACGGEDSGTTNAGSGQKTSAKADAKKPVEDAPRVVDPTKDGY